MTTAWIAETAERDDRREQARAAYLASLKTQAPLSAAHIAAGAAYKAAWKAAKKAGISKAEFFANYSKTLGK